MFGAVPPIEYYLAVFDTEDQAAFAYETAKAMSSNAGSTSRG